MKDVDDLNASIEVDLVEIKKDIASLLLKIEESSAYWSLFEKVFLRVQKIQTLLVGDELERLDWSVEESEMFEYILDLSYQIFATSNGYEVDRLSSIAYWNESIESSGDDFSASLKSKLDSFLGDTIREILGDINGNIPTPVKMSQTDWMTEDQYTYSVAINPNKSFLELSLPKKVGESEYWLQSRISCYSFTAPQISSLVKLIDALEDLHIPDMSMRFKGFPESFRHLFKPIIDRSSYWLTSVRWDLFCSSIISMDPIASTETPNSRNVVLTYLYQDDIRLAVNAVVEDVYSSGSSYFSIPFDFAAASDISEQVGDLLNGSSGCKNIQISICHSDFQNFYDLKDSEEANRAIQERGSSMLH